MKFSVATISLPNLDLRRAAKEISLAGFAGVEWRVAPRENSIPDKTPAHPFLVDHQATIALNVEAAEDAAMITRENALTLVGLGPYIEVGDEDTLSLVFEMAKASGAPQVRIQAPRISRTNASYAELFTRARDFFHKVEEKALSTGVLALLEVHHNTICSSASLTHRLVSNFDSAAIGVIYDVGNLVFEGYEDHEIALDLLGPYLKHVHLKNAAYFRRPGGEWSAEWTPLDEGIVDVPEFITVLQRFGYDGWVSIEDLSRDRDPVTTLHHNAAQLREWGLL